MSNTVNIYFQQRIYEGVDLPGGFSKSAYEKEYLSTLPSILCPLPNPFSDYMEVVEGKDYVKRYQDYGEDVGWHFCSQDQYDAFIDNPDRRRIICVPISPVPSPGVEPEKVILTTGAVHTEIIKCPQCGEVEKAVVEHTFPWWTYVHDCDNCGYTIMESEWERVPESIVAGVEQGAKEKAMEASEMVQWVTDTIFDSGNTVSKPLAKSIAEHICSMCHCEAGKFSGDLVKERKDHWYNIIKEIRKI